MEQKKKCILIGAGDFNLTKLAEYDSQRDTVIAVDGGLLYCGYLNIEPDIIIGDFDSAIDELQDAITIIESRYPEKVIRLKPEKDDTDMLVALKWGLAQGFKLFYLYGATGGRLEHTIANIQCLLYLKEEHADGYIFDHESCITVIMNEEKSFLASMTGMLSLFSLQSESIVSIKNMKYPLNHYILKNDYPIGISNCFLEDFSASVSVESGAVVAIIRW